MTATPARRAALAVFCEVLNRRRPLEAALAHLEGLDPRDAHFARAIATGTLRRLGQVQDLIARHIKKTPPRHKAGPALEILLLATYELVFLDVAPHAAVNGAVNLAADDTKARHFKPLINAVLRKIAADGKNIAASQDAARLNLPDWLWHRWCEIYGEDTVRAIAEVHLGVPPLDLIAPHTPPAGAAPLFANAYRIATPGRVDTMPGFSEGNWWIQDAAAGLPARLLGDVRGARVLDLCAAPGGKTAQLAAAGGHVVAVEREEPRMARLRENLSRLQMSVETIVADVRDLDIPPADFVLLDAPCSATGTIRRHPELPWIKQAGDIHLCAGLAGELLERAAELTAPGGRLVFAVCSLEPEEGQEQIDAFLTLHPEFSLHGVTPDEVFGHAEWIAGGCVRTLPCHLGDTGGMDGFFAARLHKTG